MVLEIADKEYMELMERKLNQPPPTAQWYRADGVPLPNLLPSDSYHTVLYRKKGWTLTPPVETQPQAVLPSAPLGAKVAEKLPSKASEKVSAPPQHMHVMHEKVGSPCLVAGCGHVRTVPKTVYLSRKSRQNRGGH